jgi:sulfate transport system ATP-binding protein
MTLSTRGLTKRFGAHTALTGIDLDVPSGELVALLGPSGCGKTTLLRLFAGLETPDAGQVIIDGRDQTGVEARTRNVGFVFQHYALFRHMSVFENVAFGLRIQPRAHRPSKTEIRDRVTEILSLVQLADQADKYPDQMSGGQRQRVALARSLVVRPRILLLDEPFGALDAQVRKELRRWLRHLHEELNITTLLVTHDQEEALEVADRVVLMNQGHIEQVGTPEDLYLRPATPFVYRFLGTVNVFHGRIRDGRFVSSPGEQAYVRPHEVEVASAGFEGAQTGTVRKVSFAGSQVLLEIASDSGEFIEASRGLDAHQTKPFQTGDRVWYAPKTVTFWGDAI